LSFCSKRKNGLYFHSLLKVNVIKSTNKLYQWLKVLNIKDKKNA